MVELDDKGKRAKRKAIEFGIRYGSTNACIQSRFTSPIALALAAHSLFQNEEHRGMMALVARHWQDPEAKLSPESLCFNDDKLEPLSDLELLCIARAMYVYTTEDELLVLTADGKEALANYLANESGSLE